MNKINDKRYFEELQKLYDLIENIEDKKLKKSILIQFIKFENTLKEIMK